MIPSPTTPVNPQQPPIPPPPPVPPTYSSNTNTGSETVAHFKRGDSKRGSIANSDRKPLSFNWREEGAPITSSTDKSIRQRSQEEEREEGELSDDEMGGVDPITTAVTNGTASATISNPGKIRSSLCHSFVLVSDSFIKFYPQTLSCGPIRSEILQGKDFCKQTLCPLEWS